LKKISHLFFWFLWPSIFIVAQQTATISGKITYLSTSKVVSGAVISIPQINRTTQTDEEGKYELKNIPFGNYLIQVSLKDMQTYAQKVSVNKANIPFDASLVAISSMLNEVKITAEKEQTNGITRMKSVEGFGIYEGKKTELIILGKYLAKYPA
jgi:Fe(3+) dicitrate transport protein